MSNLFIIRRTGVRLGNYTQQPYCDYGADNCTSYLHFGIAYIKWHEDYIWNRKSVLNDIALIRLDRSIPFDHVIKPVCLPIDNVGEPDINTMLTVAGWGTDERSPKTNAIAKRTVYIPLVNDTELCEFMDGSNMCAGVPSVNNIITIKSACDGDGGGPLMHQWQRRRMAIEGIVSSQRGGYCGFLFPTSYTRVRH